MLRQKTNIRKTKSGNIIKEVKELYLRRNIGCGIKNCSLCQQIQEDCKQPDHCCSIDPSLYVESTLLNKPYVIIPSMEVIQTQIDIFEDKRIKNVILSQTIVEKFKHANRQQYQRLNTILTAPEKYFYQFYNEFHADIFIQKLPSETVKERDERCLQNTYNWYSKHLTSAFGGALTLVVLTLTSQQAQTLHNDFNLVAYSILDYIQSLVGMEDIVDKMVNVELLNESSNLSCKDATQFVYPIHVQPRDIEIGVKNGKYLKGVFHASVDNYKEGKVVVVNHELKDCESLQKPAVATVNVVGIECMNRAFDGDVVGVEILDSDQWKVPSVRFEEDCAPIQPSKESNTMDGDDCANNPRNMTSIEEVGVPCGKVVGIIKRNWKQYCGTLQPNKFNPNANHHLFRPLKRNIPWINVMSTRAHDLANKRINVAVDSWPRHSRYPLGHYLTTLGDLGDKNVETDTILTEEGIRFQPFSKSVLSCLPNMEIVDEWCAEAILSRQPFRVDLRHLEVCSIDPPGCTDIDDALHCRPLEESEYPDDIVFSEANQLFEVGVHIADVTHFVRPGTAIDEEAYTRGTTVYLTDRRIDMIPELLSSNLCSLRENEDRLAFSVRWFLTAEGNMIEQLPPKFCKSVIRSRRALTYYDAQAILDDPNNTSTLGKSIKMLAHFARNFRKKRVSNGAIMLASSEVSFEMDQARNEPLELQQKDQIETNRLVEDFMLLANITVAKQLFQHFPSCSVLRCHPRPAAGSFKPLCDLLKDRFHVSESKIRHIEDNLKAILDITSDYPKDRYIDTLLRIMSTRCLQQALYFCSGARSESDFFHYGLAETIYTHFTSPIRRYPDVLVHRLLAASLGIVDEHSIILTGMSADQIQSMCDHLNKRNRSARLASWSSLKLHTMLFVKKSPNGVLQENAYVLQLSENAIRVYIPRFNKEGTIYFDPKSNRLTDSIEKSEIPKVTLNSTFSKVTFDDVNSTTIEKLQRVVVQMAVRQTEACHMDSLIFLLVEPAIPGLCVPSVQSP